MAKNKKEHQHYIPRFYLKGFTVPNHEYLWIYEKGKTEPRKGYYSNEAVRKNFYSFTNINGEKDVTIEDALAEIEGKAAPVFQKIKNYEKLNEDDRINFSLYLSAMLTRTPYFREYVNSNYKKSINKNRELIKPLIKNDEKNYVKPIDMPEELWNSRWNSFPKKMEEKLLDYYFKNNDEKMVKPEFSLQYVLLQTSEIASRFYVMKWKFIAATVNWKFVTSDNPLYNILGVGLSNPNVEMSFPISKELFFLGTWQDNEIMIKTKAQDKEGYFQADNNIVKEFNRATVKSALKYVFSSNNSDGLMRLVQKYKDSAPKIQITQL
ncbi:MAG: DUF4238 domain-containing protein [Nitrospirae bacterium]|nr:DUF4238 domain-containing protein [Nitrospirota bacterium]